MTRQVQDPKLDTLAVKSFAQAKIPGQTGVLPAQALMAAAPFCGVLSTLRDAAPWLELQPAGELRTLRALAALANEFQPLGADAPVMAPVTNSRPGFQVGSFAARLACFPAVLATGTTTADTVHCCLHRVQFPTDAPVARASHSGLIKAIRGTQVERLPCKAPRCSWRL